MRIHARRGVLLASGGFDHNQRDALDSTCPRAARPTTPSVRAENTGDGILAGQGLGAALDFMDDAWWMPSVEHPIGATIPLVSERSIPGR